MSRPVWPWRLAAAEGVATARTGRWASAIVVVVLAWLCAAPGAVDAITVDRLVKGEQAWIAAGAFVYRVQGATTSGLTNPVPAGACDRLAQAEGIDAAFAARRDTTPARTTAAPGGRISLIHVSPGALGFLAAASHPHGVALVTEELAGGASASPTATPSNSSPPPTAPRRQTPPRSSPPGSSPPTNSGPTSPAPSSYQPRQTNRPTSAWSAPTPATPPPSRTSSPPRSPGTARPHAPPPC
ncbi:MAG: hypothetical protein EOL89_05095 [Actinobacteria bacterium]|nr:hypothetical protein [Actinomycetota bacterium]